MNDEVSILKRIKSNRKNDQVDLRPHHTVDFDPSAKVNLHHTINFGITVGSKFDTAKPSNSRLNSSGMKFF